MLHYNIALQNVDVCFYFTFKYCFAFSLGHHLIEVMAKWKKDNAVIYYGSCY